MIDTDRLVDIVNRSLTGPVVEERNFDLNHVAAGVQRVVREYEIKADRTHVVNLDDDLADRIWLAAVDFLASCGVYSKDTGRVILFGREEIEHLVRNAPSRVSMGEGPDARVDMARTLDDPRPPLIMGGPIGSPTPNELFVPIIRSYVQEPIVDVACGATLMSIAGQEIRTKSPLEILAAWEEIDLMRQARELAGRPGIATTGIMISVSDLGNLSASSSPAVLPNDMHTFGIISELKTNNDILNKLTHILMIEGIVDPYANPIYGGLGGGVEGQAVLLTAELIALSVVFLADCLGTSPTHPLQFHDTGREIMTATSLSFQAVARNASLLTNLTITPVGGPGTKTLLYETIACAVMSTVSGQSRILGPRSATGAIPAHFSGLEARLMGEVVHAAAGLNRQQAEEVVQIALSKYEHLLDQQPHGMAFPEVYDVATVQPKDEWLRMYEEVKAEAIGWGLPLDAVTIS
jgi:methylamine--corrinoid protein Co-methyltransferase